MVFINDKKNVKVLSDVSRKMYDLNEKITATIADIQVLEAVYEDATDSRNELSSLADEVLKLITFNTRYLLGPKDKNYYMFEIDREALDVMLANIHGMKYEPIIQILMRKHIPVVTGLPTNNGIKFYCPACEDWHTHGGEGHKESHCVCTLYKGGEYMPRDNPLKNGYNVEMMSVDELRQIRDDINRYLGE